MPVCCKKTGWGWLLKPDNKHAQELNFAFDNCGRQNENHMVSPRLLCFVKRGACNAIRTIFLIKGHAKNDCDMTFNLMKQGHRKNNSCAQCDVSSNLKHPDVKAMKGCTQGHMHEET